MLDKSPSATIQAFPEFIERLCDTLVSLVELLRAHMIADRADLYAKGIRRTTSPAQNFLLINRSQKNLNV